MDVITEMAVHRFVRNNLQGFPWTDIGRHGEENRSSV